MVIGIIAILIALLLPALNGARRAAQRAACAAKLHAIMVAAANHAAQHSGYYPLAGILTGGQPQELDDPDTRKYDYLSTIGGSGYQITGDYPFVTRTLAPITSSLGTEMGFANVINETQYQANADITDGLSLTRCFLCPSQCTTPSDFLTLEPWYPAIDITNYAGQNPSQPQPYVNVMHTYSSYVFNEAVVGFNDSYGRLRGHASMVRQPSQTFFAADGIGDQGTGPNRNPELKNSAATIPPTGTLTLYNNFPNPTWGTLPGGPAISLGDLYNGVSQLGHNVAGSYACFDVRRHQNKMNIAFCDGHVETRNINGGDLASVFLLPP